MSKYLYAVSLSRGRSHEKHGIFFKNVSNLNAKPPGFDGINGLCAISHHMDRETVEELCADGLGDSRADLSVVEITKQSLADPRSNHGAFQTLINKYYLPYGNYPNLS